MQSDFPEHKDVESLFTALGPSPRDACVHRRACAEQLLACQAFRTYVIGADESEWRAAECAPAPEHWRVVFAPARTQKSKQQKTRAQRREYLRRWRESRRAATGSVSVPPSGGVAQR